MLFALASIIILPYKRSYQSGVLLMAMSNGLPVLVSDIDPMKEIIEHMKNGLIFKSENELDLAKKIDLFFGDLCENYNLLSSNAFDTIKDHYSWEKIGKEYVNHFNI